jgi:glycosyltransferase involved in cell wall biosynthesis
MKILFDCSTLHTSSSSRGIGIYTSLLVRSVLKNFKDDEIVLLLIAGNTDLINEIRQNFKKLIPSNKIEIVNLPEVGSYLSENWSNAKNYSAEIIRLGFIKKIQPDIILIPSLFDGFVDQNIISIDKDLCDITTVVIVYDLIPLILPKDYLIEKKYREFYFSRLELLKKADQLLTISECSKEDLIKHLKIDRDKVKNISADCDPFFKKIKISSKQSTEIKKKYRIAGDFILHLGASDSRKNTSALIKAYHILPEYLKKKYQLVIVGNINFVSIKSSTPLNHESVLFTGSISINELRDLYNLAHLFVFPSLYEGFGLPVLEAARCDTPVILSRSSSLIEFMEWDGAFFDASSVESIRNKLFDSLTNSEFYRELRFQWKKNITKFSWEKVSDNCKNSLKHLLSQKKAFSGPVSLANQKKSLAFVSPYPPEKTGIADYSRVVLGQLSDYYEIVLINNNVIFEEPSQKFIVKNEKWFLENAYTFDRILYHIGNSSFHVHMFNLMKKFPGVTVLHDFFLGAIHQYIQNNCSDENHWLIELYESHGYQPICDLAKIGARGIVEKYPSNFNCIIYSKGVLTHSIHSKELAEIWYGEDITSNWTVIPFARKKVMQFDREAVRKKLGFGPNDFVISSFGFIDPSKLNHFILDAWLSSKLKDKSNCYLIFVGQNHGGAYGSKILKKIFDNDKSRQITITGWIDDDLYEQYLIATDLAIQLRAFSRGETSAAVFDCLNHGIPLIINSLGSLCEIPSDAAYRLKKDFEVFDLIEAIESLYLDESKRKDFALAAKEMISSNNTPEIAALSYHEAIESIYHNDQVEWLIKKLSMIDVLNDEDERVLREFAGLISKNHPLNDTMPRLYIDITSTYKNRLKSGIERVVSALVSELIRNPPPTFRVEPVILENLDGNWQYSYAWDWTFELIGDENFLTNRNGKVEFSNRDVLMLVDLNLSGVISADKDSLFSYLRSIGVGIYSIIYDIIPITNPEFFPEGMNSIFTDWMKRVLKNSDGLVCISNDVKDNLIGFLSNCADANEDLKIAVTKLGSDFLNISHNHDQSKIDKSIVSNLEIGKTFISVGTLEPRKGYIQLIEAFDILWNKGLEVNLVIVGKEGWKHLPDDMRKEIPSIVRKIKDHQLLGKRLFWISEAGDSDLELLYKASSCYVASSYKEGFGLPLIEAANYDLPIIARDIQVFKELTTGGITFFSGYRSIDLALVIEHWLKQKPNKVRVKQHSWGQVSKQIVSIINRWKVNQ